MTGQKEPFPEGSNKWSVLWPKSALFGKVCNFLLDFTLRNCATLLSENHEHVVFHPCFPPFLSIVLGSKPLCRIVNIWWTAWWGVPLPHSQRRNLSKTFPGSTHLVRRNRLWLGCTVNSTHILSSTCISLNNSLDKGCLSFRCHIIYWRNLSQTFPCSLNSSC